MGRARGTGGRNRGIALAGVEPMRSTAATHVAIAADRPQERFAHAPAAPPCAGPANAISPAAIATPGAPRVDATVRAAAIDGAARPWSQAATSDAPDRVLLLRWSAWLPARSSQIVAGKLHDSITVLDRDAAVGDRVGLDQRDRRSASARASGGSTRTLLSRTRAAAGETVGRARRPRRGDARPAGRPRRARSRCRSARAVTSGRSAERVVRPQAPLRRSTRGRSAAITAPPVPITASSPAQVLALLHEHRALGRITSRVAPAVPHDRRLRGERRQQRVDAPLLASSGSVYGSAVTVAHRADVRTASTPCCSNQARPRARRSSRRSSARRDRPRRCA